MGAAAIIATAEQEKAELVAGGIPAEKIVLRRNGVSAPAEMPPRGTFRTTLGIPADAKLIMFLGRLSKKKSPDLLLESFAQIAASRGHVHLAFVGPDESGMLAGLKRRVAELGMARRVHFSDALGGEAKWAAYGDTDIFVLPSQNENFGNTAAESVAAGTPVIVTDRCGIAPLLAGVAGLVASHNAKSLTNALTRLLDDNALRERLKNGCAAAFRELDWESPIRQMDSLFQTLAGPSKS